MSTPATFAAVAVTIYAAHQVGDYWVQTSGQAAKKVLPGREGRLACADHVATYTLTLFVFLVAADMWAGLHLANPWLEWPLGDFSRTARDDSRMSHIRRLNVGSDQRRRVGHSERTR